MKSNTLAKFSSSAGVVAVLCGVALSARADYASTVLGLAPVGYYRLNETVAPPAADIASNYGTAGAYGNAYYYNLQPGADPANNATHGVPGALAGDTTDTAVTFDGGTQYVMMALPDKSNALNPQGAFTIEAWLNPATDGGWDWAIGFYDNTTGNGWDIYQAPSSTPYGWHLTMWNDFGVAFDDGGGTTTADAWYHVVGAFDGTNAYVYFNGQQVATGPANSYQPNNTGQFWIGLLAGNPGFGNAWAGSAEEVALYTNVLSAADVLAHYQNGTNAARTVPYVTLITNDHPLLYYRLGEPAYTAPLQNALPVAADSSTNAFDGNYVPGTTPGVAGPPFNGLGGTNSLACAFNGVCGYVQAGDLGAVPQTLSVMCWFKANVLEGNRGYDVILDKTDSSYDVQSSAPGSDVLQFDTVRNEGGADSLIGTVNINDGQWHHVVGVYNSDATSFYVDGLLDTNGQASGTLATGNEPLTIGESVAYPGRVWNGSICEVAIFNRALTSNQVQQAYASAEIPPIIVQQPQAPAIVYGGSTVSLDVTVRGIAPFTYQWTQNTLPISGQTGTNLVLNNVNPATDGGSFAVVVSNAYGAVISSPVVLNIVPGSPVILNQPLPATLATGGHVTFSVVAGGLSPLFYQWSRGSAPIAGATQSSLTFGPLQGEDAGSYSVLITNSLGSTNSTPAVLTVFSVSNYQAVVMSLGPYIYWPLRETNGSVAYDIAGGINGTINGNMVLGATSSPDPRFGGPLPAYQFDGASTETSYVDCGANVNLDVASHTINVWIETATLPNDAFIYTIITKGRTAWRLQSWHGTDFLEDTDQGINPQIAGVMYLQGTHALDDSQWHMLTAVLDQGVRTLYFDGVLDVSGAGYGMTDTNDMSVTIGSSEGTWIWPGMISDAALFNRSLSAAEVSNLFQVALNGPSAPVIGVQPASQTVYLGQPVTFNVIASAGTAPFTYQWTKNGMPILGATDQSLTIAAAAFGDSGNYVVLVANGLTPAATSQAAALAVLPPDAFPNLTNGLVLHLPFDGNYNDTSGQNNNASPGGAPTFITPGKIGSSAIHVSTVVSNSTYNYVSVPYSPEFAFGPASALGTDFSVAFWVRYTGLPNALPMICNAKSSTYNPGWVVTDDTGHPEWTLFAADGTGARAADPVPGSPVTDDGNWHSIVLTVSFASNITTYVDGVEVSATPTGPLDSIDTTNGIYLGQDSTGTYPGNGTGGAYDLDDVGLWNRALAPTEAESIYAAGQSGQSFDVVGPVNMAITPSAGGPLILWPAGTLQSAPSLDGPWATVTGAVAPSYLVTPSGAQMFYRVKL
jgi:hypothetical protein